MSRPEVQPVRILRRIRWIVSGFSGCHGGSLDGDIVPHSGDGFQRYVSRPVDCRLVVLLDEDRADRPGDFFLLGEDADDFLAADRGRGGQNAESRRLRPRLVFPEARAPDRRRTGDDRAPLLRSLTRHLARSRGLPFSNRRATLPARSSNIRQRSTRAAA